MAKANCSLSDAAEAVVERTIMRLQGVATSEQIEGLKQLAIEDRFFDVEALIALADLSLKTDEATHGN